MFFFVPLEGESKFSSESRYYPSEFSASRAEPFLGDDAPVEIDLDEDDDDWEAPESLDPEEYTEDFVLEQYEEWELKHFQRVDDIRPDALRAVFPIPGLIGQLGAPRIYGPGGLESESAYNCLRMQPSLLRHYGMHDVLLPDRSLDGPHPYMPGAPDDFPVATTLSAPEVASSISPEQPGKTKTRSRRRRRRSLQAIRARRRRQRQQRKAKRAAAKAAGTLPRRSDIAPSAAEAYIPEEGYCYELMVEPDNRSLMRRRLGPNPLKERVAGFLARSQARPTTGWAMRGAHVVPAGPLDRHSQALRRFAALPDSQRIGNSEDVGVFYDCHELEISVGSQTSTETCWETLFPTIKDEMGQTTCMSFIELIQAAQLFSLPDEEFNADGVSRITDDVVEIVWFKRGLLHLTGRTLYDVVGFDAQEYAWAQSAPRRGWLSVKVLADMCPSLLENEMTDAMAEQARAAVRRILPPLPDDEPEPPVPTLGDEDDDDDFSVILEEVSDCGSDPVSVSALVAPLIPPDVEYHAWLGDAQLSLDARLWLRQVNGPFHDKVMRRTTHAFFVDAFHPELLPPGTEWSPHSKSTFFEAAYWADFRLRHEFWGWVPAAGLDEDDDDDSPNEDKTGPMGKAGKRDSEDDFSGGQGQGPECRSGHQNRDSPVTETAARIVDQPPVQSTPQDEHATSPTEKLVVTLNDEILENRCREIPHSCGEAVEKDASFASGTSNDDILSNKVGVYQEALKAAIAVGAADLGKQAAADAFNSEQNALPVTRYIIQEREVEELTSYVGPFRALNRVSSSSPHLFLQVAREMIRNRLYSLFPHSTDARAALHIGSTAQELRNWIKHRGHDFVFHLGESKDVARLCEDLTQLVANKLTSMNIPGVLSPEGHAVRLKFKGVFDQMKLLDPNGRQRFFRPDTYPLRQHDVLFFEDCVYEMGLAEHQRYWNTTNASCGYTIMFIPHKLRFPGVTPSKMYRLRKYISAVDRAEEFLDKIWPAILLVTPLAPLGHVAKTIDDAIRALVRLGWTTFTSWVEAVFTDRFPLELIAGTVMDILKIEPIAQQLLRLVRPVILEALQRVELSWLGGGENGYDHPEATWMFLFNNPAFPVDNGYICNEIIDEKGEMVLFRHYRSVGGDHMVRTTATPPSLAYVELLDFEASVDIVLGRPRWKPVPVYFPVKAEFYWKALNFMLGEPTDALTPGLAQNAVNRAAGGLSIGANVISKKAEHDSSETSRIALSVLMETFRRQDVINSIAADKDMLAEQEKNWEFLAKRLGQFTLVAITGGLAVPAYFIYSWLVSNSGDMPFVRYPEDTKPISIYTKKVADYAKLFDRTTQMVLRPDAKPAEADCMICNLHAEGKYSRDGNPDNGQTFHCSGHVERTFDIGYDASEAATVSAFVLNARTEHERMGATKLVPVINQLHKFLESNSAGMEHRVEISYICGGPGTGKSEIIRSALLDCRRRNIAAAVLCPFEKLLSDYINVEVIGSSGRHNFDCDTTWYTINRRQVSVLFVDECSAASWDAIRPIAIYLGVRHIVLAGDHKQTSLQAAEGRSCFTESVGLDFNAIKTHELVYNYRFEGSYRAKALNRRLGYKMIAKNSGDDSPKLITHDQLDDLNPKPDCQMVFSHATCEPAYGFVSQQGRDTVNASVRSNQGKTAKHSVVTCYETEMDTMKAHGMMCVAGSRSKSAPVFMANQSTEDPASTFVKEWWYIDSEEEKKRTMEMPWPDLPQKPKGRQLNPEEKIVEKKIDAMRKQGRVTVENPDSRDGQTAAPIVVQGPTVEVSTTRRHFSYYDVWRALHSAYAMCFGDAIYDQLSDSRKAQFAEALGERLVKMVGTTFMWPTVKVDEDTGAVYRRMVPLNFVMRVCEEANFAVVVYVDGKICHVTEQCKRRRPEAFCLLVDNHMIAYEPKPVRAVHKNMHTIFESDPWAMYGGRPVVSWPQKDDVHQLPDHVGPLSRSENHVEAQKRHALQTTAILYTNDVPQASNGIERPKVGQMLTNLVDAVIHGDDEFDADKKVREHTSLRFADVLPRNRTADATRFGHAALSRIEETIDYANQPEFEMDDTSDLASVSWPSEDGVEVTPEDVRVSCENDARPLAAPARERYDPIRGITHRYPAVEQGARILVEQPVAVVAEPVLAVVVPDIPVEVVANVENPWFNVEVVPDFTLIDATIVPDHEIMTGGVLGSTMGKFEKHKSRFERGEIPHDDFGHRRKHARPDGHIERVTLKLEDRTEERFLNAEQPIAGSYRSNPTPDEYRLPSKPRHFCPTGAARVAIGLADIGQRPFDAPNLNDAGIAQGRMRQNDTVIQHMETLFNRTKAKKPKLIKPTQFRSLGNGMSLMYDKTAPETINASERIASLEAKPKLTAAARDFAHRLASQAHRQFWLANPDIDQLEVNHHVENALRSAHAKNYFKRGLAEFYRSFGRMTLYASNKAQQKPYKNGNLKLDKHGQLIVQSPPIHNAQFTGLMRVKGMTMKRSLQDFVLFDDYELPSSFRMEMTQRIRDLPSTADFAIMDFETYDSQQNEVTLEMEKHLARLMGMNEHQVEAYYLVRGSLPVKMNRIFKGRMHGEKGSGFLDTKSGNTSLALCLAGHVMKGQGPRVVAAKGDDILYVQTGAHADKFAKQEIKTYAGMSMYTAGNRNGGEFIGEAVSLAGMFPSITRALNRVIAKPAKDWEHFAQQQQAIHDKLRDWAHCGVAELIHFSALAEKQSENYVEMCYDALVDISRMGRVEWEQMSKRRTIPRYFLRAADGPVTI